MQLELLQGSLGGAAMALTARPAAPPTLKAPALADLSDVSKLTHCETKLGFPGSRFLKTPF